MSGKPKNCDERNKIDLLKQWEEKMRKAVLLLAVMINILVSVASAESKKQSDMLMMPSAPVAETPIVSILLESPFIKKITEDGRYQPEDINTFADMGVDGYKAVSVLHTSNMGSEAMCCYTVKSFVIVPEGNALKAYPIINKSDPNGTFPQIRITALYGEKGHVGVVGMIGKSRNGGTHKYKFVPPVKPGHYIVEEIK